MSRLSSSQTNIFDILHESVVVTDAEIDPPGPRIVYVNEAFSRMTGYGREELIGQTSHVLQGPKTDRGTIGRLRACLVDGTTFVGETFNYRRDRTPFLIRWYVEPLRDSRGLITHLLAVQRDVSPEIDQRNQRLALEHAVSQLSDSVVMFGREGTVTYANQAYLKQCGEPEARVVGQKIWSQFGFPKRRSELRWARRRLLMGKSWHRDYAIRGDDVGGGRFISVGVSPIRDVDGLVEKFVAVGRDVTEHRRLKAIAEASNFHDNIGVVFSGIRHELGNPINSVKTALRVVLDGFERMERSKLLSYLERINDEISRVEYLLRSLRSYGLYDRPRLEVIDAKAFLLNFLKLARVDLQRRGVHFALSIGPAVDTVWADPQALHQVLLNLIGNSSRALENREGGSIDVEANRSGAYVSLLIRDNGPGIPPEQLPHVFKPFYSTRSGGTGLGLAISRHLLSLMRGSIELRSSSSGTDANILLDRNQPFLEGREGKP